MHIHEKNCHQVNILNDVKKLDVQLLITMILIFSISSDIYEMLTQQLWIKKLYAQIKRKPSPKHEREPTQRSLMSGHFREGTNRFER